MATDARVRYTRMVIRESFIQLQAKKPFNQITVKDICDTAGINRSTFYRNYDDVFDLRHQILDDMLNKARAYIRSRSLDNVEETMLTFLSAMKEHQARYTQLHDFPSSALLTKILRCCFEDNWERISPYAHGATMNELSWFYNYISLGAAGVMIAWAKSGMQEPPEKVARFISQLITQDARMFFSPAE